MFDEEVAFLLFGVELFLLLFLDLHVFLLLETFFSELLSQGFVGFVLLFLLAHDGVLFLSLAHLMLVIMEMESKLV